MMDMSRILIDAYMSPLYAADPEGALLEAVKEFEKILEDFAAANPGSMDLVGDSGMRDQYNQLYISVINGGCGGQCQNGTYQASASEEYQTPTVDGFIDQYRAVYQNIEKNEYVDEAYQKLFDVADMTDDLIEAQLIIEKEHLVLNTLTASYKAEAKTTAAAADPNYDVVLSASQRILSGYAGAGSEEELSYLGELYRLTSCDADIQNKIKVEMITQFTALIFGWENSKRKIREGHEKAPEYAKAMVFARKHMRKYYRFLAEDMGLTFEKMCKEPFYRISLLKPEGLDALWRIKKVMHPHNLKAMAYVLFEEMLSDRTMEDILMTLQPYPYYEDIDMVQHPDIQQLFMEAAHHLNKDAAL